MIVGLASLKYVGQVDRLETQAGVNATVLRQNSFFYWKPQILLLRPSAD